jgi:hypothetical protein
MMSSNENEKIVKEGSSKPDESLLNPMRKPTKESIQRKSYVTIIK